MGWVRIDDAFCDHFRWRTASGDSIALWVCALAWCNRNRADDGVIPEHKLAGLVAVKNLKRTVADLVERGAFEQVEGGFAIHDYADWQWPEKVADIRSKRAEAGRKGAAARWHKGEERQADAMPDAMANAMTNRCPLPLPLPNTPTVSLQPQGLREAGEGGAGVDHRVTAAAVAYARRVVARTPNVRNPRAFIDHLVTDVLQRPHPNGRVTEPEVVYLCRLFPDAPVGEVGAWLDGEKGTMGQYRRADECDGQRT